MSEEMCAVTGANGFIGSHVARALVARGHRVTALVGRRGGNENLAGLDVEIREIELLDPASVSAALRGCDALVHTAACYRFWNPDPERIYRVNVEGTRNVLAAATRQRVRRVVYTSSTATLAPAFGADRGDESSLYDARRFQGDYKVSKVMAELAALRAAAQGLALVIVHPTTVVGAGDRRPTPTGGLFVHFLNGRMKAYSDTVLNIVAVEDVAVGHALALERGEPGHQYILGGDNLTMREVLEILSELTGIPAPRVRLPHGLLLFLGCVDEWLARHFTHHAPLIDRESALHARVNRAFHSDKAHKELGYRPRPARAALAAALCWFLSRGVASPRCARIIERHGALRDALPTEVPAR